MKTKDYVVELTVRAPANMNPADITACVDQLIAAGRGDAQATLRTDMDTEAAETALTLDFQGSSIRCVWCGPS